MPATTSSKKKSIVTGMLVALLLTCFAFIPAAPAVTPAPDGGYPNGNTAEGMDALKNLTAGGIDNTALGFQALFNNTVGDFNSAIGFRALFSNLGGSFNTATGVNALFSNTSGRYNQADGVNALFNNNGDNNAANGTQALFSNTTGGKNTGTGVVALYNNTMGNFNTAHGCLALYDNVTGSGNTAVGHQALTHNTGGGNIALGNNSGFNLTGGNNNIDIGSVGVGGESGMIRIGTLGTHLNTFLTGDVLVSNVTDTNLTVSAPGGAALTLAGDGGDTWRMEIDFSTGDFEIRDAGAALIFINIDDAQTTTNFIGLCGQVNATFPIHVGLVGDTTNGNGAHLTGAGVWTDASSKTFKENFRPVDKAAVLKKVTELPVQTWTYKGVPGVAHMGPVAEDFKDMFGLGENEKYLASLDSAGVALAAIQGLNEVVKQKETKIQALEKRLSRLEKALENAK